MKTMNFGKSVDIDAVKYESVLKAVYWNRKPEMPREEDFCGIMEYCHFLSQERLYKYFEQTRNLIIRTNCAYVPVSDYRTKKVCLWTHGDFVQFDFDCLAKAQERIQELIDCIAEEANSRRVASETGIALEYQNAFDMEFIRLSVWDCITGFLKGEVVRYLSGEIRNWNRDGKQFECYSENEGHKTFQQVSAVKNFICKSDLL